MTCVGVHPPPPTPPPQDSSRVVFCLSTRAHLNSLSATCTVCRWKTHQRARFCTVTGGWCSAGQHTGLGVRHSAAGGLDKRSAGCQIRVARLWAVCSSSTEVRHKCVITATPHESCINQAKCWKKQWCQCSETSSMRRAQTPPQRVISRRNPHKDLTVFAPLIRSSMIRCLQPAFENIFCF